ncbi:MAG TPA: hypothetical protein VN886_15505 [Acidimicrobiales bacterium]|nr:hypothetical protein [Acidimicrobiales bacterium]
MDDEAIRAARLAGREQDRDGTGVHLPQEHGPVRVDGIEHYQRLVRPLLPTREGVA